MVDTYSNYADLAAHQTIGVSYDLLWRDTQNSNIASIAIHGGGIEPGSLEIADYTATLLHSNYYAFDAKLSSGNSILHLTSTHYDEPNGLRIVGNSQYTLSFHGASGASPAVFMGGADTVLRDSIMSSLNAAGFTATVASTELDGNDPANITQRNTRGAGVQIEMSLGMRQAFFVGGDTSRANRVNTTATFYDFADAVAKGVTRTMPTVTSAAGSTGYGVDIFGTVRYGYSQPKSLSIEPFHAVQTDYGRISLSWESPNDSSWNRLRLVRNRDGYPSTPNDGTLLLEATTQSLRTSYDDVNLEQGKIFYYSVFMAQDANDWDSSVTYNQSDVVAFNGTYWVSLQINNTNHTPVVGSSFWGSTVYHPTWYPAGSASNITVTDYGYSRHLYDRTPQPYKIVKSDLFSNTAVDNQALFDYLSVFGFHLNMARTDYSQLLHMNNPDYVSAHNLDMLGQQFGISTDYISSPRLRRERVKYASVNHRLKGTLRGIHNAIAAVTGWDSDITVGKNMMLNSDQAAFVHPSYDLWRVDINYVAGQFVEYNGYNYVARVPAYGPSQAPSGIGTTNTWWQYQVQNFDQTTLYNNSTSGISTWGRYNNSGISSSLGVMVGVPNPSNTTYNAWNAAAFKITSAVPLTTPTGIISIATLQITTWSNSANYAIGAYVTYTDGNIYKAVKASGPANSGAVSPGSNNLVWDIQAPNIGVGKDQFVKDGIPIPYFASYDPTVLFSPGDQVQYQGNIYLCVIETEGNDPTGRYSSNMWWQYLRSSEEVYTASAYTTRLVSSADVVASEVITWYDAQGNLITTTTPPVNQTLFAKFDTDYTSLQGNTDNSVNKAWIVTPSSPAGMWQSSYGMASVNQNVFGPSSKPKYVHALIMDGRANCTIGLTFVNSYLLPTHYSSGIVFRFSSSSSFWVATSSSLYLITGTTTETVKASWPKLVDGDRMLVVLNGNNIQVKKYTRDGKGTLSTLANITDSTNATASQHGMTQRYV